MSPTPPSLLRQGAVLLLALFAAALGTTLVAVTIHGWSYYALDLAARADHPLHAVLASGAGGGVALGVVGTTLLVAMLSYSVRKRFAHVRALGPVPLWLRFHVICGVTGPVFIVLHAGVRIAPTGLIAVGFWCMVLVALSGVFGRYVYGFLPRLATGQALAWDDAMTRLADLRAELVERTVGTRGRAVGDAVALVRDLDLEAHTLPDLVRLGREVRRRRREISRLLHTADLDLVTLRAAQHALDDQLDLKRRLEASRVAWKLFRYWHLFHRPLASAMYVIVALHVLLAVLVGGSLGRLAAFLGA